MKAFRIENTADGKSYFEEGSLPEDFNFEVNYFFTQTKISDYQKSQHQAPRYQYVVTLQGKLEFKTSDNKTFILEPGIILIAKDTEGEGHSWQLIEGDIWHRLYIVPEISAPDGFVPLGGGE